MAHKVFKSHRNKMGLTRVVKKTMCPPPGYRHNGFVTTHALGHIMMDVMYTEHPRCTLRREIFRQIYFRESFFFLFFFFFFFFFDISRGFNLANWLPVDFSRGFIFVNLSFSNVLYNLIFSWFVLQL